MLSLQFSSELGAFPDFTGLTGCLFETDLKASLFRSDTILEIVWPLRDVEMDR